MRNFFRLEQHQFVVKGEHVRWMVDDGVGLGHDFLPAMYTDTSLVDGERTIIVEWEHRQPCRSVVVGGFFVRHCTPAPKKRARDLAPTK